MTYSLLAVNMATVVLESFLYGTLFVCFSANGYLQISRYRRQRQSSSRIRMWSNPVVLSTVAIFVTCSTHWILTVVRFFHAILAFPDTGATLRYFSDPSEVPQLARNALTEISVLIGDAVIVHRLWFIRGRDWRVAAVPVISWLGELTCGIAVAYQFSRYSTNIDFLTSAEGWITANWVLTVITNIYCTALIAWEVWDTSVKGMDDGPLMVRSVTAALVESAAIWTLWVVFFAATYLTGSILLYLTTELTPSIVGLVNMVIHLRVGLGWSRTPDGSGVAMTSSASMFRATTQVDSCSMESV
ncbi:hypothetical protein B0H19DRAFT_1026996 [Mycena capillaripes]|nr:hypothetical protein B0H19DRAFT_1026996 [Mycena capillaripes]